MPSTDREQVLLLRRFQGINTTQDSAFVDPSFLQQATNFVTSPTFLLSKRLGTTFYQDVTLGGGGGTIVSTEALVRTYDKINTNRYLYGVSIHTAPGPDGIWVSTNDAAPTAVLGASIFTSFGKKYGVAVLGERVYFGNGVDPIKFVTIGGAATNFAPYGSFTHVPAVVTFTADPSSTITNGVYSYRWIVLDRATGLFSTGVDGDTAPAGAAISGDTATAASAAHTVNVNGMTVTSTMTFTSPTLAERTLGATEVFQLFITPAGLPIEFAHRCAQTAAGAAGQAQAITISTILADTEPIPLRGITRRGRFLLAHRGRIWIAGDLSGSPPGINNSKVYATSTIVPGLEQTLYDTGQFFPLNAQLNLAPNDGDFVTGIGIAAITDTVSAPSSPFLAFKNNSTWALTGDIIDDDSSQLVQLSQHIGCISHQTIVNTPVGTIFCGPESVYLIRPDLIITDIGQGISSLIRQIPQGQRPNAIAIYHKGFYKLAFSPFGENRNSQQLWLDLRYGLGNPPSWWGPHATRSYTTWCVGRRDAAEDDAGFAAQTSVFAPGQIVTRLDQPNVYTDATGDTNAPAPIVAQATTKAIDNGAPFERKIFTRTRLNARTNAHMTSIGVGITVDGGMVISAPAMQITGSTGALWNTALWNSATWGSFGVFHEGESIFGADRPRGQYVEMTIMHNDAVGLDLRDFEVRYLPVERPVGQGLFP
jgi:hypothetical protein